MFLVHKREAVYKYTASTYSSHSLHRLNNSQSIHCRNYTVASAATRTSERCNYISKKNLPVDLMVRMNAEHVLFFPMSLFGTPLPEGWMFNRDKNSFCKWKEQEKKCYTCQWESQKPIINHNIYAI